VASSAVRAAPLELHHIGGCEEEGFCAAFTPDYDNTRQHVARILSNRSSNPTLIHDHRPQFNLRTARRNSASFAAAMGVSNCRARSRPASDNASRRAGSAARA
jgi:hypothetical protein